MKDCTVNSLNEGLRFQHFQNALPEVQINSTGETLQEVTKVEKTLEVTGETARQWA